MKKIILICSLLFLTSCAAVRQDWGQGASVHNGCAVDAVLYQRALKAKAELEKRQVWAKILCMYYYRNGEDEGHAMCVFEDADGVMWAYDWAGSRPLKVKSKDAMAIATCIQTYTYKAYWSDEIYTEKKP